MLMELAIGHPQVLCSIAKEREIADHLLITHGDIARGLVGYMHIVPLHHQAAEGTSHRDHIVIGVWAKNKHPLLSRQGTLRPIRVIGIGLAPWPTGDGVLDIIKHLDIGIIGRAIDRKQLSQLMVGIILIGQLQDRLIDLLAKPYNGTTNQLRRPLNRGDPPRVIDTSEQTGRL